MDFFDRYETAVKKTPDKALLIIDDEVLTYSSFMEHTSKIGSALMLSGVQRDDNIGIILPNSIEWYIIYWACIRIGARPVAIDPQSGSMEISRLIASTNIHICFIAEKYRNNNILKTVSELIDDGKLKFDKVILSQSENCPSNMISLADFEMSGHSSEICGFDNNHIMSLACTSGSTGTPKILSVPYSGFYQAELDISDYLEFTENDVMMIGMTLYHQGGFGMGLQTTMKGGTVIYQPQFNPYTFLSTIKKYKVSIIQLTSTLAKILLSVPDFDTYDLSSVNKCYFAGEVLPRELAEIFVEKLHIRVINIIGSSETATMVIWDSANDYERDPSDFKKLPFTEFRVIDNELHDVNLNQVGELCIYTSAVITDYYGNPELSADRIIKDPSGRRWFRTGDLVIKLEDGIIRFAGRSKRIIKRGGNLVYAEEVESALLTHPVIEAVAVTAEDHPVIGQQIVAYIQTAGRKNITRGELLKYFGAKLSAYKLPDKIYVVDEIPKDIGKIQFKYLREKREKANE